MIKTGKEAIDYLKDQCVHPFKSPFSTEIPMGHPSNHIFLSPADPFHHFCAGLIKCAVLWTLNIMDSIGDATAIAEFERRMRDFPLIPVLPHIPHTYFRKGLFNKLVTKAKKSRADKGRATGSGGGYRSADWIAALFQMIFVIGDGGILPTIGNNRGFVTNKKGTRMKVGNVTEKFLNCAYSILDAYFQSKRSGFAVSQVYQFRLLNEKAFCHFALLWELNRALMDAKPAM